MPDPAPESDFQACPGDLARCDCTREAGGCKAERQSPPFGEGAPCQCDHLTGTDILLSTWKDRCAELRAENERLTTIADVAVAEHAKARAENARLREAARLTVEALGGTCDIPDCANCRAYLAAKEAPNG